MTARPETVATDWGRYKPAMPAAALISLVRNTPIGRGKPRALLGDLILRLHRGPVDTHLMGSRVRLYPHRNTMERKMLLRPERADAPERALLRDTMRTPGSVFVDVGANCGYYSFDAALHAGPGSTIILIEPQAPLLERFRFNVALASADGKLPNNPRLVYRAAGAADRSGEMLLDDSEGLEHLRSLVGATSGTMVPVRPLLELVADAGIARLDVLKIDIEGFEDRALMPFLDAAPETLLPRIVIIEHIHRSEWQRDCLAEMQAKGWKTTFSTRNNTVLERSV